MFHRSSVKNSNKSNAENERRNLQKKKKKRRKRRQSSNCGTKEPKRMAETKIEWQPQGKVIESNKKPAESTAISLRMRKQISKDL